MSYQKLKLFVLLILFLSNLGHLTGQTLQELEKLKDEYSKALERQSLQKPQDIKEAENRASSTALPDKLVYSRKDVESLLVTTQKLLEELKFLKDSSTIMNYIGYEIFTKRDSIAFWQNLPVPKNYKLGPGDEIIISLWGEVDLYVNETINRDGQIYVENIGILYLGDKTLESAKEYIFKKFSRIYSTLSGNQPKTYIDLSLGDLKSLNVHFVGYVNMPGIHMVHPFSSIISSLNQAGGVQNNGSLRQIKLIRNNEQIASIDLYDYIFFGESISDIRLLDQDVIYIPPRKSTIALTGRLLNPGYFEALKGESLSKIINISGGLDYRASDVAFIYQRNNQQNASYALNVKNFSDFTLSDGDSISIPENLDFLNYVEIGGQIKSPGKYPFYEGMTLKKLITLTQSFKDKDFIKSIDLSNIVVNRKNPNGNQPIRINVDYDNDFYLKNKDKINIGIQEFNRPLKNVKITGEISNPGLYPINNQTTLKEILDLAGGYTSNSLVDGIEIYRDSLKIAWENDLFVLEDNDSLNVITKSGLVLVIGQINSPGYISYNKGYNIKKYINLAGGFNSFAERRDIFIIYPNGTAMPYSIWRSPKVKEGSTIIVNERLISSKQGLTGWEAFSAITSQAGSIATTLLSLALIANQTNGQ